jgi:hypothetical protein
MSNTPKTPEEVAERNNELMEVSRNVEVSATSPASFIKLQPQIEVLGNLMASSGLFKSSPNAAQAAVKIFAGLELGLGPVASQKAFHVIPGVGIEIAANTLASQIKASGKYTYRITEHTATACRITFYEIIGGKREELGVSEFTKEDAQTAGLWGKKGPWSQFPKNMLFARAIANGAKWHCPDVFMGVTPYVEGELQDVEIETVQDTDEAPKPKSRPRKTPLTAEQRAELERILSAPEFTDKARKQFEDKLPELTADRFEEYKTMLQNQIAEKRKGAGQTDEKDAKYEALKANVRWLYDAADEETKAKAHEWLDTNPSAKQLEDVLNQANEHAQAATGW